MAQAENLRVLIFEENADTAESLASLLREKQYPLQLSLVSETANLKSELDSAEPDIMICGVRNASASAGAAQAVLAGSRPDLPVITVSDAVSAPQPAGDPASGIATRLLSYDRPAEIMQAFDREVEILQLRREMQNLTLRLQAAEQCYRDFIEQSSDAVACLRDGGHVYANPAYMELFAIGNRDELAETGILDLLDAGEHERLGTLLQDYAREPETLQTAAFNCIGATGESFGSSIRFSTTTLDGVECMQLLVRPRQRATELQERLTDLTRRDILTGLFNRQHFMKMIDESIVRLKGEGSGCALLYILLDNFKPLRESAGVAASDILIRHIGTVVARHAGNHGYAARFGEYAFALLFQDGNQENILALGESLLKDIAAHSSDVNGQDIGTTCSIGICTCTGQASDAEFLVSRADLACEVARTSGGNQLHVHSAVVDEQIAAEDDQHWQEVVRKTIEDNRLYLVYQPIVSLKGDGGERYEVLLRVVDETGHAILPGQFLEIAERSGLSCNIDRWVINRAFKQLAGMRSERGDVTFFIKLSRTTIADSRLPGWIRTRLEHFGLDSECVTFELPEHAVIRDLRNALLFVRALEKVDCRVALEHYGIGTQPQLLDHLPVHFLKIDSSLITGLASSRENQERVKTVVKLAHEHGMKCVAERVEEAGDLATLWRCGIDFIQGNFVQEPSRQLEYDFEGEIA